RLQRRQSLSGSQDHQEMSSVAFWYTSRQSLLISSKAGNLINKVRISLSLYSAFFPLGLASPMSLAFLNKHHKSWCVLQHRFSSRVAAHTPGFAFAAKRLRALQK
ncbi:hypothetical protein N301_06480, partial [Charadrius vociferus]